MNNIFSVCILSIAFLFSGCSTTEKTNPKSNIKNAEKVSTIKNDGNMTSNELPKKIYFFQHKLISKWVHESDGRFFSDLKSGNTSKLISSASEIVNSNYANGITVTPIENKEAVLISFPEPEGITNCYFAIVEKIDSTYRYITYEKTLSFGDSRLVGVVGGWSENGSHLNYGPRSYKTASEFVKDVLKL